MLSGPYKHLISAKKVTLPTSPNWKNFWPHLKCIIILYAQSLPNEFTHITVTVGMYSTSGDFV